MEEEHQEDSGFEILTISDEDDMQTASMYSNTDSCTFESLNSFYFLESITDETETGKIQETNFSSIGKQTFDDSVSNPDSLMETFENSGDTLNQVSNPEETLSWVNEIPLNKMISSNGECLLNSTVESPSATKVEESTWFSEIIEETIRGMNTLNESKESCISNVSHSTYTFDTEQSQLDSANSRPLNPNASNGELSVAERPKNSASQMPPGRQEDQPSCCFMKYGLRVCRSINGSFLNLVSGIKSSFHKFLDKLELDMNLIMGMNPFLIFIGAETSDASAIGEVFYQSLSGQGIVSVIPEEKDFNIPTLPVSYKSAMNVIQWKMNKLRFRLHDYESVIICTTTFIFEVYPQRWQLSTMLCLEDPNLSLHLHNFTSTIPVPNDYILQAQRLTPNDYQFKDMGLAVSLGEAIDSRIDNMDLEEKLCGIPHLIHLKSAAKILAGMYSKYVDMKY